MTRVSRLVLILLATSLAAGAAGVAADAATTAAGPPVKLMVLATVGAVTSNYPDSQAGAEAAAEAINKAGGIKGQSVQILFCNGQNQPNASTACARTAVDQGVVAIVGHASSFATLELPILQQAQIPTVGNYTLGNAADWTNPIAFPMVGGGTAAHLALPFAAKKIGKKRLAIVYQDVPGAATNGKLAKNSARVAGLPVVGSVQMAGSTTDFSPIVQKLRDMNADAVELSAGAGLCGGLMRAAAALGFKPLWLSNNGTIGEAEAQQIGAPAEGMLLGATFPTFRDTRLLGIRKWVAEMKAAGKDDIAYLKPVGLDAWLGVHAIAELGAKITGDLTNVKLLRALQAQKKPLDLYGLVEYAPGTRGPAAFPRFGSIKEYFVTVKDGREYSWGPALPALNPLRAAHFVR